MENKESIIIGFLGQIKSGKTFLISQLSNVHLPNCPTTGLSLLYSTKENDAFGYIDTASLNKPIINQLSTEALITNLLIKDKQNIELFIQTFLLEHSSLLIIVINELTSEEQQIINTVINSKLSAEKFQSLICVHNLKSLQKIEQIEEYIENVLLKSSPYKINSLMLEDGIHKYFIEERQKIVIFHLIIAQENSEAGDHWNNSTISFIHGVKRYNCLKKFSMIDLVKEHLYKYQSFFYAAPITIDDISIDKDKGIILKNEAIESNRISLGKFILVIPYFR